MMSFGQNLIKDGNNILDVLKQYLFLPSDTTLKSYSHSFKNKPGWDKGFLKDLFKDTHGEIPGFITFDAIYIKSELVFKNGELIGWKSSGETIIPSDEDNPNKEPLKRSKRIAQSTSAFKQSSDLPINTCIFLMI